MKRPGSPIDVVDAPGLAAHYEALRAAVVEPHAHSHPVRARALLMRKGMAAWMRGIETASPPAATPGMVPEERPLSAGVEQRLVEILATMALATTMEVVT